MGEFNVYPAIDLRDGRVVRLLQGKGDRQTAYSDNPASVAEDWIGQGAEWLHVVDLNGAFGEPNQENETAVRKIAELGKEQVKIQLGGGLRTKEQIAAAFDWGVSRVVLGTAVMENPAFGEAVLNRFGGEKIAFGLDALGQELMSRGWRTHSGLKAAELGVRLARAGAGTLIYTNIQKDGMGTGVDWENAHRLADRTGLHVIASGGVGALDDIAKVREAGLSGVILGRALYEGRFSLKEALDVC